MNKLKFVMLIALIVCCIVEGIQANERTGKIPFQERYVLGHSPGGDDYGTLRVEYVEIDVKGKPLECVASASSDYGSWYTVNCNWEKYNGEDQKNGGLC